MARRKTRTIVKKSRKRELVERAGKAALKASGAALMGATVGVVEEAAGVKAATGVKAGMALAGLASEIFVDPEENPILSEAGKASLTSASAITGYQAGKKTARKGLDAMDERNIQKMKDQLQADMETETEAHAEGEVSERFKTLELHGDDEPAPAPKKTKKTPKAGEQKTA